jgi:hypothetical protein
MCEPRDDASKCKIQPLKYLHSNSVSWSELSRGCFGSLKLPGDVCKGVNLHVSRDLELVGK